MSLVHDGIPLFGGSTHSDILAGPYDVPVKAGKYFGLKGESLIVGQTQGRDLSCDVDALGYSSESGLASAIKSIRNLINLPLHGTLVITFPSGEPVPYESCTFWQLIEREGIEKDALTGTYGKSLTFIWRQSR